MANKKEPVIELELYLVRHGQSLGNVGGVTDDELESHEDCVLSPVGENQVRLLGEHFSRLALDHILASGMKRAAATAAAVATRQPENGAKKVEIHPLLTECGIKNEYKGKTIDEINDFLGGCAVAAEGTEGYERFIVTKGDNDCDETRYARACDVVKYLRARFNKGEKVLIAAHAAINTYLYFALLGLDWKQAFDPGFCNACVTKIVFYKEGTGPFADIALCYLNDHSHLNGEYPTATFDVL